MKDCDSDHRQDVALFRYGLIADLVRLKPGSKGLYARRPSRLMAGSALVINLHLTSSGLRSGSS